MVASGKKQLAVVALKLGVARVLLGKCLAQLERRVVMAFCGFDIGAQHVAGRVVRHEERKPRRAFAGLVELPRLREQPAEPCERLGPAGIDRERCPPVADGGEIVALGLRQPGAEQRAVLVGRPIGRNRGGDPRGLLVLADVDERVGEPDHGQTLARIGLQALAPEPFRQDPVLLLLRRSGFLPEFAGLFAVERAFRPFGSTQQSLVRFALLSEHLSRDKEPMSHYKARRPELRTILPVAKIRLYSAV